jgi:hypothetical protein
MAATFDRAAENFGNITGMEHTNVTVPDQRIATLFYIVGMGFTRDPYMVPGVINMWINIGRNQIHAPVNPKPQILRGHTGLVVPDLDVQEESLKAVRDDLKGTKFDFNRSNNRLDVICPWGNEYRCYEPEARFGPINLGMPYVEFTVPKGTADGIARFYQEIFAAPAEVKKENGSIAAHADVGYHQEMIFRETGDAIPEYDGHHLQIYLADFAGPHDRLVEHGVLSEESNQFQYRCVDIIDPSNGDKLFQIEHEIRSMSHPLYGRPFVNRNPVQTNRNYRPGHDNRSWVPSHEDPNSQLGGQ